MTGCHFRTGGGPNEPTRCRRSRGRILLDKICDPLSKSVESGGSATPNRARETTPPGGGFFGYGQSERIRTAGTADLREDEPPGGRLPVNNRLLGIFRRMAGGLSSCPPGGNSLKKLSTSAAGSGGKLLKERSFRQAWPPGRIVEGVVGNASPKENHQAVPCERLHSPGTATVSATAPQQNRRSIAGQTREPKVCDYGRPGSFWAFSKEIPSQAS